MRGRMQLINLSYSRDGIDVYDFPIIQLKLFRGRPTASGPRKFGRQNRLFFRQKTLLQDFRQNYQDS